MTAARRATLKRGQILVVDLNPTRGHEQNGVRPVIVLSNPEVATHQRYPLFLAAPLTTTKLASPLYPRIVPSEANGLRESSYVLVDQLRSIDKSRVVGHLGTAVRSDMTQIDEVLRNLLGL